MATHPGVSRCQECGWTLIGPRCAACGAAAGGLATGPRIDPAVLLATYEEDYPYLRDAFLAFRARDWRKMIAVCLNVAQVEMVHAETQRDTDTWLVMQRSAAVLLTLDRRDQTIAIDAPLVEIRPETEVGILRAALTAPQVLGGPARAARRGNKLLLTMTQRAEAMSPPRLIADLLAIAEAADDLDNILAFEFGGRLVGPQLRKGHVFDLGAVGTPRRLGVLGAVDRPVALRPRSATRDRGPTGELAVTAAGMARFLDVLREGQQLVLSVTLTAPHDRANEAALHMSLAIRGAHAGGLELDAVRSLLRDALALRAGADQPSLMRPRYARLLADRGHCQPHPPVSWLRITPETAKSQLAWWVAAATTFKITAQRRSVLLGGLCELLLFGDLAPSVLTRLRALFDASQGEDTDAVDSLHRTLEGLSR